MIAPAICELTATVRASTNASSVDSYCNRRCHHIAPAATMMTAAIATTAAAYGCALMMSRHEVFCAPAGDEAACRLPGGGARECMKPVDLLNGTFAVLTSCRSLRRSR